MPAIFGNIGEYMKNLLKYIDKMYRYKEGGNV